MPRRLALLGGLVGAFGCKECGRQRLAMSSKLFRQLANGQGICYGIKAAKLFYGEALSSILRCGSRSH
jgi:predicted Zn-dependent peptidase